MINNLAFLHTPFSLGLKTFRAEKAKKGVLTYCFHTVSTLPVLFLWLEEAGLPHRLDAPVSVRRTVPSAIAENCNTWSSKGRSFANGSAPVWITPVNKANASADHRPSSW